MLVVAGMFLAEALTFTVPVVLLAALAAVAVRAVVLGERIDRRRRIGLELATRLRAERRVTVMVSSILLLLLPLLFLAPFSSTVRVKSVTATVAVGVRIRLKFWTWVSDTQLFDQ